VESSCELGNEPSGSIKCWELPSGCTTCGLSSGTQPHRVSSSCGAPSLTRGRACNLLLQLLLGVASDATLGSKSDRICDYVLLPHLRLVSPLVTSLRLAGLRWSYCNPPPRRVHSDIQ
jgi:hypothetical protein